MKIFTHVSFSALMLATAAFGGVLKSSYLEPVPADPTSIESQLKRFKGQTQFLNASGSVGRFADRMQGQQQQQQQEGGDERDIQEADIFKVGKPGSKLLFLLNNFRGLQVVSYTKGAAHPALIGRVEATGNMPDNMYFDATNDQLIVLETMEDWSEDFRPYSSLQSRVLVYDVSQPESPRLSKVLPIDGEIADSRLVGSILYVASSVRPDWNDMRPLDKSSKGLVYSIELAKNELKVKERLPLALPTSARENMNIVSVKEGNESKYYLLAILSESRWGWWDRRSLVEVVDVSDAKGHIESKMVVSAKGDIREPSQTTIKDGTLLVVSNYQIEGTPRLARIAVETFRLPTQKSEILTEDEALRRKLNIEHRLKGLIGDERETLLAQYTADAQEGLLGRYIKTAQGLRKILADSVVTVGDDTGLSAALRDVRFSGDLLYAFWVPANQIDPLDVFDISSPQTGVRYLKRLKFDGWIERSIPVRYENRDYIFGLGYVVPTINNETRARKPQIVLFEITRSGNEVHAVERIKAVLEKDAHANFDDSDKEVELKLAPNGTGSILFKVSFRDGRKWVEGGKIAHFDLSKMEIKEGGLLKANSEWLRRVFTNSEIDRINTFSDESLATFNSNERIAAGSVANAVSILELARDIRGYANVHAKDQRLYGVQFISKGRYDEDEFTVLRLVSANRADSEVAQALSELSLAGGYVTHFVDSDETILVATEVEKNTHIYRVGLRGSKLVTRANQTMATFTSGRWGQAGTFQKLASGEVLFSDGRSAYRILGNQVRVLKLDGCETEQRKFSELQVINAQTFVASTESIHDPAKKDVQYERNFVAPLTLGQDSAQCGVAINIPGRAVSWVGGRMVSEDRRVLDLNSQNRYGGFDEESTLESLTIAGDRAALVDDFVLGADLEDEYVKFDSLHFGHFVTSKFISAAVQNDGTFARQTFVMPRELASGSRLIGVVADPSENGAMIGVLANFEKVQVVRWSNGSARPVVQSFSTLGSDRQLTPAATSILSPFILLFLEESDEDGFQISYSPELKSLQLPMSSLGVMQLFLQ